MRKRIHAMCINVAEEVETVFCVANVLPMCC
jgi:hypothetical protein